MISRFDEILRRLLPEASAKPDAPADAPKPSPDKGETPETPDGPPDDEMSLDDDLDIEDEEVVTPEELELAKLAVRALYFNVKSKDVHQYSLKIRGNIIPFEKIPDYFEETKDFRPVLAFAEHIMNKFEGISSKWTEQPEIKGKSILQKIDKFNKGVPPEEQLDNGKRVYWARIILNCMNKGNPDENIVITDINEESITDIFNLFKLHYGYDSRGLRQDIGMRAPGVF